MVPLMLPYLMRLVGRGLPELPAGVNTGLFVVSLLVLEVMLVVQLQWLGLVLGLVYGLALWLSYYLVVRPE
ncbi:hypothetical protein [Candidatus Cyanaurora vandensis]|uniref:hypothetical protein n=1 Tax=Candidatus Cyanaurora vandensis TaxID=2714958 RepID=UPI00257AB511|nr:hypothetical protein [Candidatus Cyanaurora vandensis]